MARFGDAGHNLEWMEEELLEEEWDEDGEDWEDEEPSEYPRRRVFPHTEYDEDAAVPLPAENRRVGKLLLLLLLEIAGIAAIVRWWLQW